MVAAAPEGSPVRNLEMSRLERVESASSGTKFDQIACHFFMPTTVALGSASELRIALRMLER